MITINKASSRRIACLDVHSAIYLRSRSSQFCGGSIVDIYRLIDKAASAGFSLLQFTPIQDTGLSPCPYMGISIFSLNPVYLSLHHLQQKIDCNQLDRELFHQAQTSKLDHVAYRALYKLKVQAVHQLFDSKNIEINFDDYDQNILNYAVYKSLRHKYRMRWTHWPEEFKTGQANRIIQDHPSLHHQIKFYLFMQNTLRDQWLDLVLYGRHKGVELMLDKPIYPVHDSADVWANQQLFYLKKDGELLYGSGCDNPHDSFGAQYWGHAVYKFKEKPKEVVDFMIESVSYMSQFAKCIRLDHSLALIWKYYIADPKNKSGRHFPAVKGKLLTKLVAKFPDIRFVAEDLGYVSGRNVDMPLQKYGLPGMRSPQWYYISKYAIILKYPENCLAMTSNHDLDSLPSWWRKLKASRRQIYWKQLTEAPASNFEDQVWQIINLVFSSKANIATVSMRDLCFDLRRYNKPGLKNSQNWTMCMQKNIEDIDFRQISEIIKMSNRKS